jgi:predicted ester cyclase
VKPEAAVDVYRAYNEAENAHDLDRLSSLVSVDLTVEVNGRVGVTSSDQDREAMETLFVAYPDYRREILDVVPAGDRVSVRWRMLGTPALPDARVLDVAGCSIVTTRGGRLAEAFLYYDGQALDDVLASVGS